MRLLLEVGRLVGLVPVVGVPGRITTCPTLQLCFSLVCFGSQARLAVALVGLHADPFFTTLESLVNVASLWLFWAAWWALNRNSALLFAATAALGPPPVRDTLLYLRATVFTAAVLVNTLQLSLDAINGVLIAVRIYVALEYLLALEERAAHRLEAVRLEGDGLAETEGVLEAALKVYQVFGGLQVLVMLYCWIWSTNSLHYWLAQETRSRYLQAVAHRPVLLASRLISDSHGVLLASKFKRALQ